jgi:hypothetical protein
VPAEGPGGADTGAGTPARPRCSRRPGPREADVVVAATGDDEDNLVISLLAKQEFAVPACSRGSTTPRTSGCSTSPGGWTSRSARRICSPRSSRRRSPRATSCRCSARAGCRGAHRGPPRRASPAVGGASSELDLPGDVTLVAIIRDGHVVPCRGLDPAERGRRGARAGRAGPRHPAGRWRRRSAGVGCTHLHRPEGPARMQTLSCQPVRRRHGRCPGAGSQLVAHAVRVPVRPDRLRPRRCPWT